MNRSIRGVTLIELLVAVTIGAILIFGATQVYVDSRNAYALNETTSRMQEAARYAFNVIEPDVRMANYWGLVKGASVIQGQAAQTVSGVFTNAGANDCGTNFIADLATNIEGANNQFAMGPDRNVTNCAAFGNGAVAAADTLTVRRASTVISPPATGFAHICSTRVNGLLHTDNTACATAPAGQGNFLIVDSYYVSQDSDQQVGLPSLRRKKLITGPTFSDEEVIAGVEDMQIEFGIDPTGTNGNTATRYVEPGTALATGAQVVSVRIWLLVRSDSPEVGFTDNRKYVYGDRKDTTNTTADLNDTTGAGKAYEPGASTDDSLTSVKHYRRLLVSRTLQVRNAMGT